MPKNVTLADEITPLEVELEAVRKHLAKAKRQHRDAIDDAATAEDDFRRITGHVASARVGHGSLVAATKAADAARPVFEANTADANKRAREAGAQIDQLNKRADELQSQITRARSRAAELANVGDADELADQLAEIQAEVDRVDVTISEARKARTEAVMAGNGALVLTVDMRLFEATEQRAGAVTRLHKASATHARALAAQLLEAIEDAGVDLQVAVDAMTSAERTRNETAHRLRQLTDQRRDLLTEARDHDGQLARHIAAQQTTTANLLARTGSR